MQGALGAANKARTTENKTRTAAAHTAHGRQVLTNRKKLSKQLTHLGELEELARTQRLIRWPNLQGRSSISMWVSEQIIEHNSQEAYLISYDL